MRPSGCITVSTVKSGTPEGVLRGWGLSREYSGDIITEQNIHTLDVMNWIIWSLTTVSGLALAPIKTEKVEGQFMVRVLARESFSFMAVVLRQ